MKRMLHIVALLSAVLCLASCVRDHLYYSSSNTATVRLDVDWSNSGLTPNGLTVYAYADDGKLYRRFDPISTPEQGYINLPQGNYTLVLMNDTPEEFAGNIDFVGMDRVDQARALGVKDDTKTNKLHTMMKLKESKDVYATTETKATEDMYCIVEPEQFAVAIIRNVAITADMIDYFYDKPEKLVDEKDPLVLEAAPKSVLYTMNVKAHVKGLQYAKGTTMSFFRGAAAGYCMGLGQTTTETVSHGFILNNRTFDPGSNTDGTISATFCSLGLPGMIDSRADKTIRNYLDINFVLINGESYPLTFDVTDDIKIDISLELQLTLNLNLEIELPEAVGGNDDGDGFRTDVGDWNDINYDITM